MATLDKSLPMLFLRMFHRLTLLAGQGEGRVERRRASVTTLLTTEEIRCRKRQINMHGFKRHK